MKKILIVFFLCIFIVNAAGYSWAVEDDFEPDDTFILAKEIIVEGEIQYHNFHNPPDEDWVKFNADEGQTYGIEAKNLGSNGNVVLEIYDIDGTTFIKKQDTEGDPQADEILIWDCPSNGTYYVRVKQYEPCSIIDTYCENTEYDLQVLLYSTTLPTFIVGTVTDAHSGESIEGASITTDGGGSAISLPNGSYLMPHLAGIFTMTAQATGYNTQIFSGIIVDEGVITTKDIDLVPEIPEVPDTKPSASIIFPSSDVTVSEGEAVYFRGSATDGNEPFEYLWDFGGGADNHHRKDPGNVTFTTEGLYEVTFAVTDADGDTDSELVTVTVYSELSDTDGDGINNLTDTDDDNDGLPDTEEQGPGGDDPYYDGNRDGTADRLQAHVTSLHTHGNGYYVTLETSAGTKINDCRTIDNPSPEDAPTDIEFLYGFFEFTIEGVDNAGFTTVVLHLPEESNFDTYYKFGPTPDNTTDHWYEFLYDGQTGAQINGNVITLHFIDGMRGDDDLLANGTVVDAGGPGRSTAMPDFKEIYFPHVASDGIWETEIGIINTNSEQSLRGVLQAFSDSGQPVDSKSVALVPKGRIEVIVDDEFFSPSEIGYIIFKSDSGNSCGYLKFYVEGKYRVAIPAASEINSGDIYISHIASDTNWTTGISILNTTSSSKNLSIEFDNGTAQIKTIAANEHQAFTIRGLFGGKPQPDIKSGVIKNGNGIVGLEIFGSTETSGLNYLSGILLKDETTTNIYYPHIASNSTWGTGVVAYNPSATSCDLTITPYSSDGTSLSPQTLTLSGQEKYIGTMEDLSLPNGTAWFSIEASSPITGFEMFSTKDGNQLGGYTGVGISGTDGLFAKIDKDGGTGIAFVNIENFPASVTMNAYDDNGIVIATESLNIPAHGKLLGVPSSLFSQDISSATYIAYSSDRQVVGFQLNVSSDDMMLDALPGM